MNSALIENMVKRRLSSGDNIQSNRNLHFAAIISGKKILSTGFNYPIPKKSKSRHAEISAFIKLDKKDYKKNINIVVININRNGKLKNSMPCSDCINFLKKQNNYKINRVYFSTPDGFMSINIKNLFSEHKSKGSKLCKHI